VPSDLRALQVAEQRDVLAHVARGLARTLHPAQVVARSTMREIHAQDVGAGADDFLEDARRVRGRAERGDDLGPAAQHRVNPPPAARGR